MALKFHDVFAGIAVGAAHENDEGYVDQFAVGVQNVGEAQLVSREIRGKVGNELMENFAGVRAAYAYNTDAATPGWRGDGGDRFVGRHHRGKLTFC